MTTEERITSDSTKRLLVEAHEGSAEDWDRELSAFPDATQCHLHGWRDVLADTLGHECNYWKARDPNGHVVAALPLVRVRSRIFGDYLISMPFLNGGGAVGSLEGRKRLESYAVEQAKANRVDLLELRSRRAPVAEQLAESSRKITVELKLPDDPRVLLKGFHQKLRANINKATKAGMVMRYGADQVEPFYEVFARNMRDLGTPVLPKSFFEAIARRLPSTVTFGVLWSESRPVAAQCAFIYRDVLEMVWGSSISEFNKLKVSSHIHFAFIERAISAGCSTFDFGRCTEGSGTHQFKQQWGGVDVPLPWGQWSPRGVASTPSPQSPMFRMAVAAWQRLPLSVTNRLGPLLARSIP